MAEKGDGCAAGDANRLAALPDVVEIRHDQSMKTPAEKAEAFWAMHQQARAWVIPNPWDAGSARVLERMGFQALATSSSASAGTLGRADYGVTRDEALDMARRIVEAVDVPVSADLENGYGDSPDAVAETVRRAAEIGLAGCSIEDARGDAVPYDIGLATERVAAAVEAARGVRRRFVLTARAENFARGVKNLDDTIARLQAFERAGADVLFPIGVPDLASYRAICAAVTKPVNAIGGIKGRTFTLAELEGVGVKRVSVATALWRAAMTAMQEAALEIREKGTFEFGQRALGTAEIVSLMG
jgi:2-methylisocitrate lyase-like PEP mutase family enzyme